MVESRLKLVVHLFAYLIDEDSKIKEKKRKEKDRCLLKEGIFTVSNGEAMK